MLNIFSVQYLKCHQRSFIFIFVAIMDGVVLRRVAHGHEVIILISCIEESFLS